MGTRPPASEIEQPVVRALLLPVRGAGGLPIGPPAYSLTWLEVMAGQFCMAVVVAQLVGLKLAQALRGDKPEAG